MEPTYIFLPLKKICKVFKDQTIILLSSSRYSVTSNSKSKSLLCLTLHKEVLVCLQ